MRLWRIYPPAAYLGITVDAMGMETVDLGKVVMDPERETVVTVVLRPAD